MQQIGLCAYCRMWDIGTSSSRVRGRAMVDKVKRICTYKCAETLGMDSCPRYECATLTEDINAD